MGSLLALSHEMADKMKKDYTLQIYTSYLAALMKQLATKLEMNNINLGKLAVRRRGGNVPGGEMSSVRRGMLNSESINIPPVLALACRYALLCAARDTDEDGDFDFHHTELGYDGDVALSKSGKNTGSDKWTGICPPAHDGH